MTRITIEVEVPAEADEGFRLGKRAMVAPLTETALCRSDEASFDRFLSSSIPQFAHLSRSVIPSTLPPGSPATRQSDELADAICSQLGLPPGSLGT